MQKKNLELLINRNCDIKQDEFIKDSQQLLEYRNTPHFNSKVYIGNLDTYAMKYKINLREAIININLLEEYK